ncbi:MAG TPA: hypothetical protein VF428_08010 [Casimicrobiaceae bacterium]
MATPNDARTARATQTYRSPSWFAPPTPTRGYFGARVLRGARYSVTLVAITLVIGMLGYHAIEGMSWLDAFHQAALLLSGMGPVIDMKTVAGKIFDSIYALFCGVVLLAATALMFAPVIHRILHRFRIEDTSDR